MSSTNRRQFLKAASLAGVASASLPYWFSPESLASPFRSPNERPVLGCIGTGDRWNAVGPNAMKFSDCAAVCDVDVAHVEAGKAKVLELQSKPGVARSVDMYEDYRRVLDRKDIDVVTIVTPDHWHTKIAIEAMKAGKDVYCEKPLTLTIDEGKQIRKVLEETGRVFQVGTQQRSEMDLRFLHAVALIREGRIGELKTVTVAIGGAPSSGPIDVAEIPKGLNWDMWLGQAPMTEYRFKKTDGRYGNSRCHYEFRWWYEYSGGKFTDWGAHHIDIALWAAKLSEQGTGPVEIDGTDSVHPVEFKDGNPLVDNSYNTSHDFNIIHKMANGLEIVVTSRGDNGILIEGTKGRIFVNREKITGLPIEEHWDKDAYTEDDVKALYKSKKYEGHKENFYTCIREGGLPVSDVYSHLQTMNMCHLSAIAARLKRTIRWNPKTEMIEGDDMAKAMQARKPRAGFEIPKLG